MARRRAKSKYDARYFVEYGKWLSTFKEEMLGPDPPFAILRIEAKEKMGKTWLLAHMEEYCRSQEDRNIPVVRLNFQNPFQRDSVEDYIKLLETVKDKLQHPHLFKSFDELVQQYAIGQRNAPLSAIQNLIDELRPRFPTMGDVEKLADRLDIFLDNMSGDTLDEKLRSLIMHFYSRKMLQTLFDTVEVERPSVTFDWKSHSDALHAELGTSPRFFTSGEHEKQAINEAFFDCLSTLLAEVGNIVFLIDAYEEMSEELRQWSLEKLLPRFADERLQGLVLVAIGMIIPRDGIREFYREEPEIASVFVSLHEDSDPTLPEKLKPFELPQVEIYMEDRRGLPKNPQIGGWPEITWDHIHLFTGGVPGEVAHWADKIERELKPEVTERDSREDSFFTDTERTNRERINE